jgi:AcrR family transcriptional regulator
MGHPTKESLVQAALKLFGRYGFHGVSVRQISHEAKCNLASISYHFRGKDELYRHCMEDCMLQETERFEQILAPARSREDFEAKLHLFLHQFYDHMVTKADVVRMVMHEMHDPSPVGEEVLEKLHRKIPALLMSFVEAATKQGILRSSIEAKTIVDIILSICTSQILFEEHIKKIHGSEGISDSSYRTHLVDQIMLVMSGGIYAR